MLDGITNIKASETLKELKMYSEDLQHYSSDEVAEALDIAIKALEQTRWIPCSEKLPEKNVWVLVTVEQSGIRYQEIMRRNNYRETWTDDIDDYADEITAWMPLPQPYTESEEENE